MVAGDACRGGSGGDRQGVRVRARWLVALVLLLPVAALAQTPLAAPGKAGWTPAGKDCFVWNRAPGEGETASWSGPCIAQRASGKGVLVWTTPEGEQRYEGEMRDGKVNGAGKYYFSANQRYEGNFKDDDFDGQGTFVEPGTRFEGLWKAGRKNGRGVLTTMNGDRYDGEFKDDQIEGQGTLLLSDGRKYQGLFHNGRPNGAGTLTDPTGTYTGTWIEGCFKDATRRTALGVDPASCK